MYLVLFKMPFVCMYAYEQSTPHSNQLSYPPTPVVYRRYRWFLTGGSTILSFVIQDSCAFQHLVHEFQADKNIRVAVLSIKAAGVVSIAYMTYNMLFQCYLDYSVPTYPRLSHTVLWCTHW